MPCFMIKKQTMIIKRCYRIFFLRNNKIRAILQTNKKMFPLIYLNVFHYRNDVSNNMSK